MWLEKNERGEGGKGTRPEVRGQMVCTIDVIDKILTSTVSATRGHGRVLSRGMWSDVFNMIFLAVVHRKDCRRCGL